MGKKKIATGKAQQAFMLPRTEPEDRLQQAYLRQEDFCAARDRIIGKRHDDKGIGTLSEKTVHAVLKLFIEPDEDYHEVALEGYFADIFRDGEVTEIQTRSFNRLREKLAVFLNSYPVTVVYPMPANKWLSWISEETGEISDRRLSPRHFTGYDAFFELYRIKPFLRHPNLRIHLYLMDMEEYKLLNGWNRTGKKGASRYDRIPLGVREIITLDQPEDYLQFVPYELGNQFTSSEFAGCCHISRQTAGQVLQILHFLGVAHRVGKKGNSYLYEVEDL